MKREHPLGVRRGDRDPGRPVLLAHLLQSVQICQTPLQIRQARAQDGLSFVDLQKVKESDAGEKLGVRPGLFGPELAEIGLQQLDPALGQVIKMAIGLALLRDDLPGDSAHLFEAFEGEIERLVVEGDHPAKRPLNVLLDLVAMPRALAQHGQDQYLAIHMLRTPMILSLMRRYHRWERASSALCGRSLDDESSSRS